jgi:hypothetical protein
MADTLADHLRSLPDDRLGALIELRPDLVVPVPADLSALAVRAQSRVSVTRALDGLDQFTLEVLDALRLARTASEPVPVATVLALAAASEPAPDPAAVHDAIDRLRAHALVYGPDSGVHLVSSVDEVCSPYPAGLGRPAAELDETTAELVNDPARLRRTLLAAPPAARAVLDRLAAGPPLGTTRTGTTKGTRAGGSGAGKAGGTGGAGGQTESPVDWLVAAHLLVPIADDMVELPREVGLLLRRDAGPLGPLRPAPPPIRPAGGPRGTDPRAADSAGAGQTMEAVSQTEALLETLDAEPAATLRSGGLGVRELRRLARAAGVDESVAALLLELAYAARLLGTTDGGERGTEVRFLPAARYDGWRTASLADRWAVLAGAWLNLTREPRLVGERDERDRPVNALSPEVERVGAPAARRAILRVLVELAPGAAPGPDEVLAQLAWRAPRRVAGREQSVRAVLTEAAALGVTGLGAITSYGRALLHAVDADRSADDDPLGRYAGDREGNDRVVEALAALLPEPVDHVLVQADLTVVVPGPPEPALAAELRLVAEHESAGGATVYRVTPESVRRALDAGYPVADLHALFSRRSRTPVPQALTYLLDDVARRHGGLRVGTVGAYLRSDDEALLVELLVDRGLAPLALRRLAPTVLVTPYAAGRLLNALREAGYAPVPEDASGAAVLTRPKARRAPGRTASRPWSPPRLSVPQVRGIVQQLRRGDAASRAARRAPVTVRAANGRRVEGLTPAQAHTQALAVLQQALRDKARVWVGYVDAHGSAAQRLVRPVSIGAGYLRAEDERSETLHTFALHRITAAVLD